MPKILITGNGFDLRENLPTKYTDFISVLDYINADKDLDFHSVYSTVDCYAEICKNYNEIKINIESVEAIKSISRGNKLLKYFKEQYAIDSWIDFENRLEHLLRIICEGYDIVNKNVFNKGPIGLRLGYYRSNLFDNRVEVMEIVSRYGFCEKINDSIKLNKTFLIDRYGYYTAINLEKLFVEIEADLHDFTQLFNLYLRTFVLPLYSQRKAAPTNIFSNVDRHFTFNYTPTFKNFYCEKIDTNFLHGQVDEGNIVLGVDDFDPEKLPILLKFTKYYQKYSKRTHHQFLNQLSPEDRLGNFHFYFWGHSLDRSDAGYINQVFDFVTNIKRPVRKIFIVYHSEDSYQKLLLNLFLIRGKKDIEDKMGRNELVFVHDSSSDLNHYLKEDITIKIVH